MLGFRTFGERERSSCVSGPCSSVLASTDVLPSKVARQPGKSKFRHTLEVVRH